ncbi:Lar family restriction alleviation protein [Geobacter sp. 60473]|uniref:Lar family restriction alleviation protein n=1 Tax=Geobacter sp. 60473 TaxID=3080755 RepID=UPI00403EAFBE
MGTECPFCGGENISVIKDGGQYACLCGDCSAQGPASCTREGAAEAWDERA